jgi:chemotaxis protein MotB
MRSSRRAVISYNPWPGFVDALSALLMVVIFVILIFVLAQFMLSKVLTTQENELATLQSQIEDLVRMLGLESERNDALRAKAADREARIRNLSLLVTEQERLIDDREETSAAAKAEIAALDLQLKSLRQQLEEIGRALSISEEEKLAQEKKLEELGRRLNIALARQVNKLRQYQSEFFGRLRETIGDDPNVQIVGDRFVLQAELLFDSGSAELGPAGSKRLGQLADVLKELARKIPDDLEWILRIDGHTDRVPIHTEKFPSNWELSTARAMSVLRFLAERGIPENRLAATGFSEFHPLDPGDSPEALRGNRRIEFKLTSR